MKPLIAAGLMLIAAGCAVTGNEPASYAPQSGPDTDAQARARIHTDLAAGYLELGNYGVALQEAAEALKSEPDYASAHNVLGLIYMELHDDKAAETSFQRALRVSPADSDANHNYGTFLCRRKRDKESIKYFLAALRNPLYATPEKSWVNAGMCAQQAGDSGAAEEYFQKALKLRPAHPQALFQLAELAYQRRNYQAAKAYLERRPPDVGPGADVLWLALRIERGLGNRNAESSLGFQLRKNFPDSREARALMAGQYE